MEEWQGAFPQRTSNKKENYWNAKREDDIQNILGGVKPFRYLS
jgi:hypothetical protein